MKRRLYAATQLSLEEIALQFLAAGERGALKVYLLRKLDQLPAGRRAQRLLLCTWLTEIYLDEISGMSVGEGRGVERRSRRRRRRRRSRVCWWSSGGS